MQPKTRHASRIKSTGRTPPVSVSGIRFAPSVLVGNAAWDALRPVPQSGTNCIPTQSVGTIKTPAVKKTGASFYRSHALRHCH